MEAPQAIHRQRMRADLQHREFSAGVANLRQEALQVNRFGSGVGRRILAGGRFVRDCPEEPGFGFGSFDDGVNHRSGGGFAVSSGDGYKLQGVAGMIVKIGGGNGESFASFANSNGGNAGRNHTSGRLVAHHCDRAALNGVRNERLAVLFRAAQREENCAGLHFARITNDLADFRRALQRREGFDAVKYFRQIFRPNFARFAV